MFPGWEGLFPSFVDPNSDFAFWLGGSLLTKMVHSGNVLAFVPLGLLFTCGVNFYYNDGTMSFGVILCSILPLSWISLDLTGFWYLPS